MTQDEIDTMWQKAMHQSIKEGEMFTRYQFAHLVAAKATEEANARANVSWTLMCKKMVAIEREALAQPEQEPVKWSDYEPDGVHHNKPEQDTIQRLSALVRAQQITIDKLEAQQEQLREENERLHVENRRLIDRIETIGVPVGVNGWMTTTSPQPEQEPVAYQDTADKCRLETVPAKGGLLPQRTWVDLTDEQIEQLEQDTCAMEFPETVRAIEAKLKERNT